MQQARANHIGYLLSSQLLTSRWVLWSLLIINALGTAYGYLWYGQQMEWTAVHKPLWMLILVPDSPTASLFFTLSVLYLLTAKRQLNALPAAIRGVIETIGVVTSFKYGIWAVSIIAAGTALGDALSWQDWMLSLSHLGMAAEALLFVRFFNVRPVYLWVAAAWVFGNDIVDYEIGGIYPWLPENLNDKLQAVAIFTFCLSAISLAVTHYVHKWSANSRV